MDILLYEHLTAGGAWGAGGTDELLPEGAGMLRAVAEDFARLPTIRLHVVVDRRFPGLLPAAAARIEVDGPADAARRFAEHAGRLDACFLIAPEIDGILARLTRCISQGPCRLLSPGTDFVVLASNKQATLEHLAAAGVPVPAGRLWGAGEAWPSGFPLPAVSKPVDGAGSLGVRRVWEVGATPPARDCRLERWVDGVAASVLFLCGPGQRLALPPARQHMAGKSELRYMGGELPLPDGLARRAARLAELAMQSMPPVTGFVGVDLILGQDATGRDDVVLEVNPRLTTSYLGLRRLADANLAAALLEIAEGRRPELSFGCRRISFAASGQVRMMP